MRRLLIATALLLALPLAALGASVDLLDLNVAASRVPEWYPFDETVYTAAQSWPEYDVTCSSAPCGSGKLPITDDVAVPGTCGGLVSTSDFQYMNCFIEEASNNVVLYIPAGTYTLTGNEGSSTAPYIGRSNIVLRGAGPTQTILERDDYGHKLGSGLCGSSGAAAHNLLVCGESYLGSWVSWDGGYGNDATSITVANGTTFDVNGWIILTMDSDDTGCEFKDKLPDGTPRTFTHIDKITAKVGTTPATITLERGLKYKWDGDGCEDFQAAPYNPTVNVGVEDIRFTSDTSLTQCGAGGSCIYFPHIRFRGVANSWLVGNRIDRGYWTWTIHEYSARNWSQGNDYDNLELTPFGPNGVVVPTGAHDNVFENNTFSDATVGQKIELGAGGNIIGYSYVDFAPTCAKSFFMHGDYTQETLYEGNDVNCYIMLLDAWWGRNGPRNTAYRNRNRLTDCGNPGHGRAPNALGFNRDGHGGWYPGGYSNVIGNTVGELVNTAVTNYDTCNAEGSNGPNTFADYNAYGSVWIEKNLWRKDDGSTYDGFDHGSGNDRSCGVSENDSCDGTNLNQDAAPTCVDLYDSPACPSEQISGDRDGTCDVACTPSWSGTYPTSLYHTSIPSWWCQEACDWSQDGIGAFGDDFGGAVCKLPAELRYNDETCTAMGAEAPSVTSSGGALMGGGVNPP